LAGQLLDSALACLKTIGRGAVRLKFYDVQDNSEVIAGKTSAQLKGDL
jgi:hypothetical protein